MNTFNIFYTLCLLAASVATSPVLAESGTEKKDVASGVTTKNSLESEGDSNSELKFKKVGIMDYREKLGLNLGFGYQTKFGHTISLNVGTRLYRVEDKDEQSSSVSNIHFGASIALLTKSFDKIALGNRVYFQKEHVGYRDTNPEVANTNFWSYGLEILGVISAKNELIADKPGVAHQPNESDLFFGAGIEIRIDYEGKLIDGKPLREIIYYPFFGFAL